MLEYIRNRKNSIVLNTYRLYNLQVCRTEMIDWGLSMGRWTNWNKKTVECNATKIQRIGSKRGKAIVVLLWIGKFLMNLF
jgi:hypothetical protein